MRARSSCLRNNGNKLQVLLAQVLAHMPTRRNPIKRAGWSFVFNHGTVCPGVSQMHIGEPDHKPGAENVVHRRLLVRCHVILRTAIVSFSNSILPTPASGGDALSGAWAWIGDAASAPSMLRTTIDALRRA